MSRYIFCRMSAEQVSGVRHRSLVRERAALGYWPLMGIGLLSSAWFAGVHMIVQSFVRACDASDFGLLLNTVLTLLIGWICLLGFGYWAYWLMLRPSEGFWIRRVVAILIACGVVAVTWGYLSVATSTLASDTVMSVNCPSGTPNWWPRWIPLP